MTAGTAQKSKTHMAFRPLAVVSATLASVALTATPALAVPPPEPFVPDGRSGSALSSPDTATSIPDTISTAQVVAISFVVALLVGLLLVVGALLLARWSQARRTVPQVPAQRDEPSVRLGKDPVGAGG